VREKSRLFQFNGLGRRPPSRKAAENFRGPAFAEASAVAGLWRTGWRDKSFFEVKFQKVSQSSQKFRLFLLIPKIGMTKCFYGSPD